MLKFSLVISPLGLTYKICKISHEIGKKFFVSMIPVILLPLYVNHFAKLNHPYFFSS